MYLKLCIDYTFTDLFIRAMPPKVVLQVTISHQFHDYQAWLSFRDHTQQPDHVVAFKSPVHNNSILIFSAFTQHMLGHCLTVNSQ